MFEWAKRLYNCLFEDSKPESPAPAPEEKPDTAPISSPYREPVVKAEAIEGMELSFTVSGEGSHSKDFIATAINKSKRRAKRYFQGKEVKHRVTKREKNMIQFAFARGKYKSLVPILVTVTRTPLLIGE